LAQVRHHTGIIGPSGGLPAAVEAHRAAMNEFVTWTGKIQSNPVMPWRPIWN
jgi:hypothetical protein